MTAMRISVIIPTLNERHRIGPLIARLRESGGENVETVVADASADGTAEAARAVGARVVACARPGRGRQLHEGALAATGDVLLFLHADTELPASWLKALERAWSAPKRPAATAFRLRFDHPSAFYRVTEGMANWRCRRTHVPHGDQAIAVSRKSYFEAGGFEDVPLLEEYRLMRRLKRLGPFVLLEEPATTSARRYERHGRIRRVFKNQLILALYGFGVPIPALARLYR